MAQVSKQYGAIRALNNVTFAVRSGEIRALAGENGSGKSTLIKILSGYCAPDPPTRIRLRGEEVHLPIRDPLALGIAVVHQDLGLNDELTVWENLGIGLKYNRRLFAPIDRAAERKRSLDVSERFCVPIQPDARVGDLSQAERSIVAILRILRELGTFGDIRPLVVLDEPTARLAKAESDLLLSFLGRIRDEGAGIIFVSHYADEILRVADQVTVLRDGAVKGTYDCAALSHAELTEAMAGGRPQRNTHESPARQRSCGGTDAALRVEDIGGHLVRSVSFEVRAGTVVGITGRVGMGQSELPYLIAGASPRRSGVVDVGGARVGSSLRSALAAGLVLVPENRLIQGFWKYGTAAENLSLPVLGRIGNAMRVSKSAERILARSLMQDFGVRPLDPSLPITAFSGGNQQKLLLGKWLQTEPRVIVLHAPTQGVDISGRAEILRLIRRAATQGTAVVMCSDDVDELVDICDRILIMKFGLVVRELCSPEISEKSTLDALEEG